MGDFAARLRRAREAKGVTLYRLAQLTGISKQGVINLERDDADPKLSTVEKVARALGVSVVSLLADPPAAAAGGGAPPTALPPTRPESTEVDLNMAGLYEEASPLIDELEHWGRSSRYEQAPSELLKIATKLKRLFEARLPEPKAPKKKGKK